MARWSRISQPADFRQEPAGTIIKVVARRQPSHHPPSEALRGSQRLSEALGQEEDRGRVVYEGYGQIVLVILAGGQ